MEAALREMMAMCRENPSILGQTDLADVREFVTEMSRGIGTQGPAASASPGQAAEKPKAASAGDVLASGMSHGFNLGSFLNDCSDDSTEDDEPVPDPAADAEGEPCTPVSLPSPSTTPRGGKADREAVLASMDLLAHSTVAWESGHVHRAVSIVNDAIAVNPRQALLYAARAQYFLHLRRPQCAIRDANTAISLNPDSALAHKLKGRAYEKLKKWENALVFLRLGNQLVYDEDSYRHMKRVEKKCKEKRLEELVHGKVATEDQPSTAHKQDVGR